MAITRDVLITPGGAHQVTGGPPVGWQAAVAAATAAGSWAPITDWYAANTGHEALGYAEGDLTSGSLDSDYDGQIFEGITASRIRVGHNNVTIRGCRVVDGATYGVYLNPTFGADVTGLLIEHCTFVREAVDPANNGSNIAYLHPALGGSPGAGFDVTVRYCNAYNWSGGIKAFNRVLLEYNYIHDMQHPEGVHMNCARPMGQGARLYRNCGTDGRSGTFSIYFDKEVTSDITVEENICAGVSPQASPSYHHAIKSGTYGPTATNIVITGSMFGPGQYGPGSGGDVVPWGTNGNSRTGNHFPIESTFFGADRDLIEGDETTYAAGTCAFND